VALRRSAKKPLRRSIPRIVAFIAFLIGLVGAWVSLPLLLGFETSLWFLIGASSWGFFLWRLLNSQFREEFFVGWIWSALLHFVLLPLSIFIPVLLDSQVPVPLLILIMFVLSIAGLFSDLYLSASQRTEERLRPSREIQLQKTALTNPPPPWT
jgi:hypothetical protein